MRLIRAFAVFSKRAVNSGRMLQALLNGPRSKLGPQELRASITKFVALIGSDPTGFWVV